MSATFGNPGTSKEAEYTSHYCMTHFQEIWLCPPLVS